jgi:peptidoglycan/LPS O-acetylase OafA/YrhL
MHNDRYSWVNALRGYAIVMVVLVHTSQVFKVSNFIKIISDRCDLGVQLFFIMSSFTLFNSYSKRIVLEGDSLVQNFFIRRFFRIAPYYYVAGLTYVFFKLFVKNNPINIKNLIANFTFTNGVYLPGINDIPPGGWSIGVEMLFYLFIPILYRYLNSLNRAIVAFLALVICSILINHSYIAYTTAFLDCIWEDYNKWSLYFWLPNQLPVFVLGIVLYYINKKVILSYNFGQILLGISIVLFAVLSLISFSAEYPFYFFKKEYIYGIIFVLFAVGLYTTNNKVLINSFIQKIGIVSFSVYLNHFLIITLFSYAFNGVRKIWVDYLLLPQIVLENDLVFVCFYFLILLTAYHISNKTYHYVEVKGISLGEKLIIRLGDRQRGRKCIK